MHHFDGRRLLATLHSFGDPETVLSSIEIDQTGGQASGDPGGWEAVPRVFTGYLRPGGSGPGAYYVFRIDGGTAAASRLGWFTTENGYDLDYQGIVGVAEVPGSAELLFGVQRSSNLVLCSPDGAEVIRKIALTGTAGNPSPRFRRRTPEVVATDFNVLACVDAATWRVARDARVDDGNHFVGEAWWPTSESHLVVARPRTGDAVVVDMESFRIQRAVPLGRQPLEAAQLPDGTIVARDWMSGDLLLGS